MKEIVSIIVLYCLISTRCKLYMLAVCCMLFHHKVSTMTQFKLLQELQFFSLIFYFFDFCRQRSLTQQWYLVFFFTACPSSQHLIFCSLWALLWQRGFYTCQGILSDIINNDLWELSINYPLYVRQCFKVSGHVVTFKSQVFNKQVSQTVLPP